MKPNEFEVKVFCGNCYKESILRVRKGTELNEKGWGEDKSIKAEFPNGKWGMAQCPKCDSMRLNKRF